MVKVTTRQKRPVVSDADKALRGNTQGGPPALGARIRELRLGRNLTLAELAAASGISIGTLSQMERDLVSPTVRTLFTLSGALDVSPAWLIDPEHDGDKDEPYIVRADRRVPFLHTEGLRKDLISPAASKRLKGFYLIIEPGGGSGPAPYVHTGEEIGLVISGVLELRIEDSIFVLREGDCFSFASNKPHSFSNVGTAQATVFWVNADL